MMKDERSDAGSRMQERRPSENESKRKSAKQKDIDQKKKKKKRGTRNWAENRKQKRNEQDKTVTWN